MNYLLSFVASVCLLASLSADAQNLTYSSNVADVYMSQEQRREAEMTIESFESVHSDRVIIKMSGREGSSFVTFDDKLEIIDTKKGRSAELQRVFTSNKGDAEPMRFHFAGRDFCLKGVSEPAAKTNRVMLYEIDMKEQLVISSNELSKIQGEGYYREFSYSALRRGISSDGSKMTIIYKLPEKKDDKGRKIYRFRFTVFDEHMTKLWDREVEFIDPSGELSVGGLAWSYDASTSAFSLCNNGNIMCWARTKSKEYLMYNISSDSIIKVKVPKLKEGNWIDIVNSESMVLLGFYKNKEDGDAAGIIVVNWDGKGSSEPLVSKIPFTVDHLTKNKTLKEIEKIKKDAENNNSLEIKYLNIIGRKILDDNSVVLLCQKSFRSQNGFLYKLDYHVFHISPRNELLFSTQIPYLSGGDDSGYEVFIGNTLYLMFNDRIENQTADWSKMEPEKYTGPENVVSLIKIDFNNPEINPKRFPLWNYRDVDGEFHSSKSYSPPGADYSYVYIQGERLSQRLIKIKFK